MFILTDGRDGTLRTDLFLPFVAAAKAEFTLKFGHAPKIYDVVISDGARKL